MDNIDRQAHWQNVYAIKAEKEVSWFQENPAPSLDLIAASGISTDVEIIDEGAALHVWLIDLSRRATAR